MGAMVLWDQGLAERRCKVNGEQGLEALTRIRCGFLTVFWVELGTSRKS